MKYIKFFFTVVKNFFLIIYHEIRKKIRKYSWLAWIILAAILAGATWGGMVGYKKYKRHEYLQQDEVSLSQAAKMGEMTTQKLMVQIENPKGNQEDLKGRYKRGDIVLIKPGNFEFSEAEKSGFLILHMDLTDKQAEILVRSKQTDSGKNEPDGHPKLDTLERRRYTVDLSKIGLLDGDQSGREISDKIFKWDVVLEKK